MISKRIRTIASLIEKDKKVIDIGCDHAFLALVLRSNGHQGEIVCTDLRKGPCEKARENLDLYGYTDIPVIRTPGVEGIEFQADVAVMAGMGYKTVRDIISNDLNYFRNCEKIIIQLNHSNDLMRRWLVENGFSIANELMIKDYKYYEILTVENGYQPLTEDEIVYGPVLLRERSPEFTAYYTEKIEKLGKVLAAITPDHPDYEEVHKKREVLIRMLKSSPLS